MSYFDQDKLKLQKRRPSITRLTPEEAINSINKIADEANERIARALAHCKAWEQVANNLYLENEGLREQIAELNRQNEALEAENARLRKKVTRKAGKHKDEEWDE